MRILALLIMTICGLSVTAHAEDWTFEARFSFVPQSSASSAPSDIRAAQAETAQRFEEAKAKGVDHIYRFCGKERVKSLTFSQVPFPQAVTGPETVQAVVTAVCDESAYNPKGFIKTY